MKIKFMYENNCIFAIFLRLNGIAKINNAKIKMLRFGAQIAKISNRRKYPLYSKYHIHQHGITMYIQWSNYADVRVNSSYRSMG